MSDRMTPKERLLTVMRGEIPDRIPVAPDFSNMIPARLTGLPFWDLYLYRQIPIWDAYIDCAKHFGIDSVMDGYKPLVFPDELDPNSPPWECYIVEENQERIVVQNGWKENGHLHWQPTVNVFYRADSPTHGVPPTKIGLPDTPSQYRLAEGIHEVDLGPEGFAETKRRLGDQGLIGAWLTSTCVLSNPEQVYDYIDHPEKYKRIAEERIEAVEKRFARIMTMDEKPDFLCVGGSGTLVMQTVEIFRELALPAVKRGIELTTAAGIPTHVHSCGPEKQLVKIMAEETNTSSIV